MFKVLHYGLWFIFGHFLSVRQWKPNFLATEADNSLTSIWVRLPQLLTEFYNDIILEKIGNTIGRLLKVDTCTSSILRGRYAKLCRELPLEEHIIPFIHIGSHKQHIQYEDENFLCKNCGRLGHVAAKCEIKKTMRTVPTTLPSNTTPQPNECSNARKINGEV